jgi:hypothetical protein
MRKNDRRRIIPTAGSTPKQSFKSIGRLVLESMFSVPALEQAMSAQSICLAISRPEQAREQ